MSEDKSSVLLVSLLLGILFCDVIVNGVVFLVPLSDSSLLMGKNATDFGIFTLYPAALINLSVLVFFGGIIRLFYVQHHVIYK